MKNLIKVLKSSIPKLHISVNVSMVYKKKATLWLNLSIIGSLSFFVLSLFISPSFAEDYQRNLGGKDFIRYTDGNISMVTSSASLHQVLKELAQVADITITSDAPIDGLLTIYIDNSPLDKALKKILRGIDTTFIYGPQPESASAPYQLSEVRLFLAKEDLNNGHLYPSLTSGPGKKRSGRQPRSPSRSASQPKGDSRDLVSTILNDNLSSLDEFVERIREENAEGEKQIDYFADYLDELKGAVDESGEATSKGLKGPGPIMQQLLKGHEPHNRAIKKGDSRDLVSTILNDNPSSLDEFVQRIREENTKGETQIDYFADYLDELKGAVDESGEATSEGLKGLGPIMQQLLKGHERHNPPIRFDY